MTYIESLDMAEQFSLTPAILGDLPARLIAVYKLWKDGEDLRGMYPKATFYRYRREFLNHGIDIAIANLQRLTMSFLLSVFCVLKRLNKFLIGRLAHRSISTPS